MPASRILLVALAGEGTLALLALAWAWTRGLALGWGDAGHGVTVGLGTAAGLAVANYALLRLGPDRWPVSSVRRVYRTLLRPLFARVDLPTILGVSIAAGVGEELFFRGAVQGEFGLIVASAAFGAAHVGSVRYAGFGLWAGLIGALLGWLAEATGGLLAPIVAHAVYDALALAYVRWAPEPGTPGAVVPQEEI